jgi:hypothetical protein
VVGHEGYVQGLKLMTVNSNVTYIRKVQEVVRLSVRLNLSHDELSLRSDVPFRSAEITLQNACCTKNICTELLESRYYRTADLFCPFLGDGKKSLHYKCLHMAGDTLIAKRIIAITFSVVIYINLYFFKDLEHVVKITIVMNIDDLI